MSSAQRTAFLDQLDRGELEHLLSDWTFWARDDQLPPSGAQGDRPWAQWLILGGRGAGKTRAGAEWLRAQIEGVTPLAAGARSRAALIAETYHDARAVMVEGPSGLLALAKADQRPDFLPSQRLLRWPNGAEARLFSSEDPEALRGPQFDSCWSDELAKWHYADDTWDMLQFALRLGVVPQQVITTTPRPTRLVKALMNDPATVISRAATAANAANLAPAFLARVTARYGGTALGRQELGGELIEDVAGALWTRSGIEAARAPAPELVRIVVAADPPASSGPKADACGIVVAGRAENGEGYVLADRTVQGLSPGGWSAAITAAYHEFEADRVIVEVNQGGDMVRAVMAQADATVPVHAVRASRGKRVRAEPVAALYERGLIHHCGCLPELEDEMAQFAPGGGLTHSPDRLDALVWALTALFLSGEAGEPRIRSV